MKWRAFHQVRRPSINHHTCWRQPALHSTVLLLGTTAVRVIPPNCLMQQRPAIVHTRSSTREENTECQSGLPPKLRIYIYTKLHTERVPTLSDSDAHILTGSVFRSGQNNTTYIVRVFRAEAQMFGHQQSSGSVLAYTRGGRVVSWVYRLAVVYLVNPVHAAQQPLTCLVTVLNSSPGHPGQARVCLCRSRECRSPSGNGLDPN